MPWWSWLLIGAGVAVAFSGLVLVVAVVGSQSHERRGGVLELDTWEARNALRLRDGETAFVMAEARFLGRCGHLVAAGNEYVVRQHDGARFCSPRCASAAASARGLRPFAGVDGDAA